MVKKRDFYLDLFRAILASLVLFEHFRHCIFFTYSEQSSSDLGWEVLFFYGLTSLGKQAVIGFFCLSGYFAATSIQSLFSSNLSTFEAITIFLAKRISRIYTLFLPLLLLSLPIYFLSDIINPSLVHDLTSYGFGSSFAGAASDLSAFIPTLLLSPAFFGKQVWQGFPISWSLVNEIWYYLSSIFIGLYLFNAKRRLTMPAAIYFVVIFLFLVLLQARLGVLRYFPFFVASFAVSWIKNSLSIPARILSFMPLWGCLTLFLVVTSPITFILAEEFAPQALEIIVGLLSILIIISSPGEGLPRFLSRFQFLERHAIAMSNHSYSLYLSHSLLIIGFFGASSFNRMPATSIEAYALFLLFVLISYFVAWLFYVAIDSRHSRVAKRLLLGVSSIRNL
jgi:peptidoglycan/LPS O-acetylase OafA/YrhL